MIKQKKKKNNNPLDLPERKDPLDDVKEPRIDRKFEIPDPLDDVK